MSHRKNRINKAFIFLALSILLSSCNTQESSSTDKSAETSNKYISKESFESEESEKSEDFSFEFSSEANEISKEDVISKEQEDESEDFSESISEQSSEIASEDTSRDISEEISENNSEPESEEEPSVTIESAGIRFADKFTNGEVIRTENSYMSENVCVTLSEIVYEGKLYFVQDIYIKKIESFAVGFAGAKYGKKYNDYVFDIVEDYRENGVNVIGAINGDYCRLNNKKATIRNGIIYNDVKPKYTICVLYKNGIMKTVPKNEFDANAELEKGAWHAWDFGPSFLDKDGNPITDFTERTSIKGSNPRSAIGYYEPGHYCFVTAGGRSKENSYGVTYAQISRFMSHIECNLAYNLDGGDSAVMVFNDRIINEEFQGTGRRISDIVYISDVE